MNYSDYLNLSHEELAYIAFCREQKHSAKCDTEAYTLLKPYAYKPQEHFFAIATDAHNQVVDFSISAIGQDDRVSVSPKDIFRNAILANAHKIIIAHNHPSGSPVWSQDDIRTTANLVSCGKLLNIHIVDHILIYGDNFSSLASLCDISRLGASFDFQGNLHSNDYTFKVLKAFAEAEEQAQEVLA